MSHVQATLSLWEGTFLVANSKIYLLCLHIFLPFLLCTFSQHVSTFSQAQVSMDFIIIKSIDTSQMWMYEKRNQITKAFLQCHFFPMEKIHWVTVPMGLLCLHVACSKPYLLFVLGYVFKGVSVVNSLGRWRWCFLWSQG